MSDDTKLTKFESELRSLAKGDIFHTPAESLSSAEAVTAYTIIKFLKDHVERRREELRDRVLSDKDIVAHGKPTASGGTNTSVRGHKVTRKRQLKRFGNLTKLRELMEAKGLEEEDVFDEIITRKLVVNPSKLERLCDIGRFSEDELDSCHNEVWTLTVVPSEEVKSLLDSAEERASREELFSFKEDEE